MTYLHTGAIARRIGCHRSTVWRHTRRLRKSHQWLTLDEKGAAQVVASIVAPHKAQVAKRKPYRKGRRVWRGSQNDQMLLW